MKKKFFTTLLLALLITALGALPAFAGEVNLKINGNQIDVFEVTAQDGTSMVSAEAFGKFAGADVSKTGENTVEITEQGKTLSLTAGQLEGQLNNEPVELPCAPAASGDNILIPLRYTANTFGYVVGWDNEQKAVTLTREETRDGMSPSEVVVKSNQVMQEINTYAMEGNLDMDINFSADGKEAEDVPQKMNIDISGQFQNDPVKMYIKQTMSPVQTGDGEEITTETYMTGEKMYVKVPEIGWTVQDAPFSAEFFKEQQDIQSDPLKAVEQMEEMGVLLNFGNDTAIEDTEYYVVNGLLDMEKFQDTYRETMMNTLQAMQSEELKADAGEIQEAMQQLIDNMDMNYYYTVYINKESMLTDIIKYDITMNCTFNPGKLAGDTEQSADIPEEITVSYDMKGSYNIKDVGEPFNAPDVSDAKETGQIQQEKVENPVEVD